ncbi:MAG TPA: carboxypeptidase regulatory-like domain-containing protein [Polyangia bacterium]|nr:carboxypeptidase regulatory-like domain-containing protein [Polyangia bacterium]
MSEHPEPSAPRPRPRRAARHALVAALLAGVASAPLARAHARSGEWLGEEMPLPLAVKTAQDLAVKAVAEKQYLIFNLLAGGKLAWDAGDFAAAAAKWEQLLRVPGLDPEIERVIRPLAVAARERSGEKAPAGTPPPAAPGPAAEAPSPRAYRERLLPVAVSGTVAGGGAAGPGGAVVWLRRANGDTPRPAPAKGKVISQRGKAFVPHVLAVPVGTTVDFRNDDAIFHNVFSLNKPNDFDTGLYRQGGSYAQTFKKPGAVQLLCNIHSSMIGYVYVVDSPWYAQADGSGAFTIRGVPPGEYEVETWHESASKPTKQRLTVGADGVRGLELRVGGDRRPPAFVPDKSGKPRQSHLGY